MGDSPIPTGLAFMRLAPEVQLACLQRDREVEGDDPLIGEFRLWLTRASDRYADSPSAVAHVVIDATAGLWTRGFQAEPAEVLQAIVNAGTAVAALPEDERESSGTARLYSLARHSYGQSPEQAEESTQAVLALLVQDRLDRKAKAAADAQVASADREPEPEPPSKAETLDRLGFVPVRPSKDRLNAFQETRSPLASESTPKPPPPPPPIDPAVEARAETLLRQARNLEQLKNAQAPAFFRRVVATYPGTKAAETAAAWLEDHRE